LKNKNQELQANFGILEKLTNNQRKKMSTTALVFLTNLQISEEQIQKEKNKHWKFNVLE
jgi:hypothetical protein